MKRFDEVDVTKDKPSEVESTFRQFLARDSIDDFKPTLSAASDLYRRLQDYQEQKRLLTEAWNELANDENGLAKLVLKFAETKEISTNLVNVRRFLESIPESLVNEVPAGGLRPPKSFALRTSPTGNMGTRKVGTPIGWNRLLLDICRLMSERHPESFRKEVLSMTDRFAGSEVGPAPRPVGDTGIFAKYGGAVEIRNACYEIVTRFGYPKDSLVIKDSRGTEL